MKVITEELSVLIIESVSTEGQAHAVIDVLTGKISCYTAEKIYDLPSNSLSKLVGKCRRSIKEHKRMEYKRILKQGLRTAFLSSYKLRH